MYKFGKGFSEIEKIATMGKVWKKLKKFCKNNGVNLEIILYVGKTLSNNGYILRNFGKRVGSKFYETFAKCCDTLWEASEEISGAGSASEE